MRTKGIRSENTVRPSKLGGYGVFAGRSYQKGEEVDRAVALVVDADAGGLENYTFEIDERKCHLVLGNGSIFNHSEQENLEYFLATKRIFSFVATRDVQEGEELTINYGEDWFEDRGMKRKGDAEPAAGSKRRKVT